MSYFKENLKKMDFNDNRSLLFVSDLEDRDDLIPVEVFALEKAREFKAKAVYFRHFSDGRTPIPQIYIYDNTANNLDNKKLAKIHRDLWSYCLIPMFLVIEATDVKIFDARKPVDVSDGELRTSPIFPAIAIASVAIKQYSRKLFDSGIFWETDKARGHFLESTSAYKLLIDNLKTVRKDFAANTNLPTKTANKLLVFSILIKYLEERGGKYAQEFFQKTNAKDFCDVLKQGKLIDLFDELSQHFNGKIFEWSDSNERDLVQNTELTDLALFLYGDIDLNSGQYSFWRKYSFSHLPVELISSVYEELLNERDDAVYTPAFLVNTLIDESMPQKDFNNTSVKTIDVSCGSGIFLVSAFKRLVQRHRYAEFKETRELKRLKSEALLQIIRENIFGIDIEEDARRLTVFSVCLALCDELTPPQIWEELQFDNTFETNFKTINFFEYIENESNFEKFNLVIGNPPFKSLSKDKNGNYFKDENGKYYGKYKEKTSEGKIEIKRMYVNEDINSNGKKQIYPDNQTALMFLDQAPLLLKENGLLCLIMPVAPLLYNNSFEFKKHFFPKHQIYQILDFTNLDSVLFEADVPTAAIFAHKQEHNEEKSITHITVRRMKSIEDKIFFEIDKYDFHYVSQQNAINDKHVWKCNLLGGGRLHNLVSRLSDNQTIEDYIDSQKWHVGEGYIDSKVAKEADYLSNKYLLHADGLTEKGISPDFIEKQGIVRPHRKTNEYIFQPPHILIKENIGKKKIPMGFSNEHLTFRSTVIGISAFEAENKSALIDFYNDFKKYNDILRFYISATSNQFLVTRGTLLYKQDLMNLPYPEDKEEMQLSFVEQIICDDVLNYYIQIKAKSSNAKMNNPAETTDLEKFGEVFNKMLNSVYGKSGKSFYLKRIHDLDNFFITEFNYGENNTEEAEIVNSNEPTEYIKSLIKNAYSSNVSIIRVLKLYERNKIYLVKPKALRYWLRSTAIKDADEAFSDSIKAGY